MRLTLGKIGWEVVGVLFLITPLFAATSKTEAKTDNIRTYNWAYAEEASELLRHIKELSTQLAEDTHFLELHSRRNQLNWRSHALQLHQIRGNINMMGKNLQRLQEIHSMTAPWQQKAVDRIAPRVTALAEHTEVAITYLRENQGNLWAPQYKNPINALAEHAEEIKNIVSMFLDYGKTSDRLRGLENQIEFTGA